jgi:hypothetical protein
MDQPEGFVVPSVTPQDLRVEIARKPKCDTNRSVTPTGTKGRKIGGDPLVRVGNTNRD